VSTDDVFPDEIRTMPATAKLVYKCLEEGGPATKAELVKQTGQSERAVETALRTLADRGAVISQPDLTETRRDRWCLDS
jgi:transcription initiation factor IIE alpha subunit